MEVMGFRAKDMVFIISPYSFFGLFRCELEKLGCVFWFILD